VPRGSPIRILVLPTDEELRIAQETMHIVSSSQDHYCVLYGSILMY